jgi:hypothetical protein
VITMQLHRLPRSDDTNLLPPPFAAVAYVAGIAVLAWSAYAFAGTSRGDGLAPVQAEPWRPAPSKWARRPAGDARGSATTSVSASIARPATPRAVLSPRPALAPQAAE